MPAERWTAPPCPHEAEFGEDVEWPDDVSLAHFDNCLTPDGRLFLWKGARRMADHGSRCTLRGHAMQIRQLQSQTELDQAFITAMVSQLRELEAYCKTQDGRYVGQDVAERLRAIIEGTSARSITRIV